MPRAFFAFLGLPSHHLYHPCEQFQPYFPCLGFVFCSNFPLRCGRVTWCLFFDYSWVFLRQGRESLSHLREPENICCPVTKIPVTIITCEMKKGQLRSFWEPESPRASLSSSSDTCTGRIQPRKDAYVWQKNVSFLFALHIRHATLFKVLQSG